MMIPMAPMAKVAPQQAQIAAVGQMLLVRLLAQVLAVYLPLNLVLACLSHCPHGCYMLHSLSSIMLVLSDACLGTCYITS